MTMYMKIDGFEGNVTAKGHEKWIEISSLNFSVARNINTKPGSVSDRESTKPSISEIEITKTLDKTTPNLFSEACVGKVKSVSIDICQTADTISAYMKYTLTNAIVSSYAVSVDTHDDRLSAIEKVKLNFNKIEMKFIPYDEKHNAGSPVPAGYDLCSAKKI